jgi:hypothetical protein
MNVVIPSMDANRNVLIHQQDSIVSVTMDTNSWRTRKIVKVGWRYNDIIEATVLMQTALAHRHNRMHEDSMICIALAHWNNSPHGDSIICIALAHWNNSMHGDSMIGIVLAHWSNSTHRDSMIFIVVAH